MKNILHFESDLQTHWSANDTQEVGFTIKSRLGAFQDDGKDLLNVIKGPYVPQKGDKIYFLPEVSVPRVKFKNVSVEYGIKTVRDALQANVFFGCSKSIHHMTNSEWLYKVPTSEFKEFVELIDHRLDQHTKDKIETALEFYDNEVVAISWNIMNNLTGALPVHHCSRHSLKLIIIDDNFKEEYEHLQSLTIYDESSVIDILNGEDATVIDKVMFEHLCDMFKSSDSDNHVLAMEIMANSKYTESLVYLELLFTFHAGRIIDSHTKNHVNFKSLVSYLGKNMRILYTDVDDVVTSLIAKDQFTPDKLEIVMEYLSEHIQNTGDSKFFTVKTITVHPDHIAQLGSNYTYEVQADYVGPEIPIEHEEEERVPDLKEVDVFNEAMGEIIDEIEESLELHPLSAEVVELEPESNNHQINTNESNDIDWF